MVSYRVTTYPRPYADKVERVFTSRKEAREYARYQVKLGWMPHTEELSEAKGVRKIVFPSVALVAFRDGVFI